jgi:hypothetical protein
MISSTTARLGVAGHHGQQHCHLPAGSRHPVVASRIFRPMFHGVDRHHADLHTHNILTQTESVLTPDDYESYADLRAAVGD